MLSGGTTGTTKFVEVVRGGALLSVTRTVNCETPP